MIEILHNLPQQQRLLVSQHEGLVRAYRLAQRYRRMVREIAQQAGIRPVPAPVLRQDMTLLSNRSRRRTVA